jgi:hypothetical protein
MSGMPESVVCWRAGKRALLNSVLLFALAGFPKTAFQNSDDWLQNGTRKIPLTIFDRTLQILNPRKRKQVIA